MPIVMLEGLDAVGKATQSKMLAQHLDATGRAAVTMSFPRYDTDIGRAIRRHLVGDIAVMAGETVMDRVAPEDPLFFQALMLADKCDAVPEIAVQLARGRVVILDRWSPSALCFGEADGLDAHLLQRMQEVLPMADLSVLIDVPEEEALRRRPQLRDRYENDRAKQAAVRANYNTLWSAMTEEAPGSWVRIDGTGTPDDVHVRIWAHVERFL